MLLSSASRRHQAQSKLKTFGKTAPKTNKPSRTIQKSPPLKQPTTGILSKQGHRTHPQKTVSISGVFKKPIVTKGKTHRRSHRRHKPKAPEHELFLDYQDTVTEARDTTISQAKTKLAESHNYLLTLLKSLETKNQTFRTDLEEDAELIFAPLSNETVETFTNTDDGSEIKKTVEISKRLAAFKLMVEKKRGELMEFWGEWEGVQREIVELGAEVFGEGVEIGEDREFEKLVGGLEDEIEGIEGEFVERMMASEKEIALRQKNERLKLLKELLDTDN